MSNIFVMQKKQKKNTTISQTKLSVNEVTEKTLFFVFVFFYITASSTGNCLKIFDLNLKPNGYIYIYKIMYMYVKDIIFDYFNIL